jgi:hypothetical protein
MLALTLAALACQKQAPDSALPTDSSPPAADSSVDSAADSTPGADSELSGPRTARVTVTLDGAPAEGVLVMQAGATDHLYTDADGRVDLLWDPEIEGDYVVIASHPEARVWGNYLPEEDGGEVSVALERFDTSDNEAYTFQDPGTPTNRATTEQCAHCHLTTSEDWSASAHAGSASNPAVQDLYAGAAAALSDQSACEEAGGSWWEGLEPGTGAAGWRCYLGEGVLPALNECGEGAPCDGVATAFGGCADCHAPGIDGALGGRDLLEAVGLSYEHGVHCDVCHKVESVELGASPGVAGALRILRPTEEPSSVINPRMGAVYRDHYKSADFCGGCHQQDQPVLVPDAVIDSARWPEGLLPVHSTWAEWEAGPMNPGAPCQSCHMPPDAEVGNGADLGLNEPVDPGIAAGWWREPGTVRRHTWFGPRSDEQRMLELAASVSLALEQDEEALVARVTTRNVGPGHAIPTGEPLRSLILRVEARCGETPLAATGGDVVPDFGGAWDSKAAGEDWTSWPGATPGQVLRVIAVDGWRDYQGFGPFGDGSFDAEAKGLPAERLVGEATILSVDGDGAVTLDAPLPPGDRAYRVDPAGLPADGEAAGAAAGAPGFGFARVMVGADGARMVPHFLAVDVASDNRLLPQSEWTSEHTFAPGCEAPEVEAVLYHRAYPLELAAERGWTLSESRMTSAVGTLP